MLWLAAALFNESTLCTLPSLYTHILLNFSSISLYSAFYSIASNSYLSFFCYKLYWITVSSASFLFKSYTSLFLSKQTTSILSYFFLLKNSLSCKCCSPTPCTYPIYASNLDYRPTIILPTFLSCRENSVGSWSSLWGWIVSVYSISFLNLVFSLSFS